MNIRHSSFYLIDLDRNKITQLKLNLLQKIYFRFKSIFDFRKINKTKIKIIKIATLSVVKKTKKSLKPVINGTNKN